MTHLVRVGVEIKPTVCEVGDGPRVKSILVVEPSADDALAAAASGRDLCRPEEVVVGAIVRVAQATTRRHDLKRLECKLRLLVLMYQYQPFSVLFLLSVVL